MPQDLTLTIKTDEEKRRAELQLLDAAGVQLGYHAVDFGAMEVSTRDALFDLRSYLLRYVEPENRAAAVRQTGVALAEKVLGKEIFARLWAGRNARTLQIRLPEVQAQGSLAMEITRIPWEIARPAPDQESLAERNLLVRMVPTGVVADSEPLPFADVLRVLFVFAEARGSKPLGMRQERLELLELFEKQIYPKRRVVAHFLGHGVTRGRLEELIRDVGGFHVVHWSGHGEPNLLELCQPGGKPDYLSGEELLKLFLDAGGYLPHLFMLSACHSGEVAKVTNWLEFLAVLRDEGLAIPADKDLQLDKESGFVGTAHALLQGGVPAVVAMRFAVGDEYARELTKLFYERLLADEKPKPPAQALTQARNELLRQKDRRFTAADSATPLLYGDADLKIVNGRSPAIDGRRRRIREIGELARHEGFVGRTWELAGLGSDFIGTGEKPIAQIVGIGGMGKTALAAEVLDVWEEGFDWVLIYQGKPNALAFDATLRDIHLDLMGEEGVYAEFVTQNRADAIRRDATPDFQGERRLQRLIANLVRTLEQEKILLVFDNFETALKPHSENDAGEVWACQDPAWDVCFATLAVKLLGTGSRVLVTTRHPLASLAKVAHQVVLGPLPYGEAILYLRQHSELSRMFFGDDNERELVLRLLYASRFHPLLMDRLAKLAVSPELRPQLFAALETLEKKQGYVDLPDLFGAAGDASKETVYLRDALESSLDLLIHEAGPDARRLLWMISLMNQPEAYSTFQVATKNLGVADLDPLLRRLVGTGLVGEVREGAADQNPNLACHELVRERIRVFLDKHPHELGELTGKKVRLAYADHLVATFRQLLHQDRSRALAAGSRALVYCVDAEAWDRLEDFAGWVVTTNSDPRFFEALLPHLQKAAEAAPEGEPRWRCKIFLADTLANGGRADASLPFYEEAAHAARLVAAAGGEGAVQARIDLAAITGNWAIALRHVRQLPAARERFFESAEAERQAGRPAVYVLASELGAARIAVMLGQAEEVLGTIEAGVVQIAGWWRRHRAGEKVAEAPDAEFLARALVSALDIARDAQVAREDWKAALGFIDSMLEMGTQLGRQAEELAGDRMNRANVLGRLGRFGEAKTELEVCLQSFAGNREMTAKTLSSVADLLNQQGDVAQAIVQQRRALGLCEHLPDPQDRAISHGNLANYLKRRGQAADLAESRRHQLVALVYRLVAGLGQDLKSSMRNFVIDFRWTRDAGRELKVPRLAELLADPAFAPVGLWLEQRGVAVENVQAEMDGWLARIREAALASDG